MKVTVIPFVIGVPGTITIGLVNGLEDLEIRGRVETIQTTTLLRSLRILRRVLETWGDLLSLKRLFFRTDFWVPLILFVHRVKLKLLALFPVDPFAHPDVLFCPNWLHSLIMSLIRSSLSPHNIYLLFCCVLSILALI